MNQDHGCALYVPHRTSTERAAGILRQALAWHSGGGSMTTRIGDTVHYVATVERTDGTPLWTCRAATVTDIGGSGDSRGLHVLDPVQGAHFVPLVPYDSPLQGLQDRDKPPRIPSGGTWHGMDECNPDGSTLSRLWSGDSSGIGPVFRR